MCFLWLRHSLHTTYSSDVPFTSQRELINYWKEHGRGADKLEGRTADGNKGDYWVPGMFAPEEMMIFTQRLKVARGFLTSFFPESASFVISSFFCKTFLLLISWEFLAEFFFLRF